MQALPSPGGHRRRPVRWRVVAAWSAAVGTGLLITPPVTSAPVRAPLLAAALAAGYLASATFTLPRRPRLAFVVAGIGAVATSGVLLLGLPADVDAGFLGRLALAGLPAAVPIAATVGRRIEQAVLVGRLRRLTTPATGPRVRAALAELLQDDGLDLLLRQGDGWVRVDGRATPEPHSDLDRVVQPVGDPAAPVALVVLRRGALRASRRRIRTVLEAATPAVENVRLQAALGAQLLALRASRERIVRAAVEERHRLARDLHDGAQQHLLVLATRLAGLTPDRAPDDGVRRAQAHLGTALTALRGLAREVYPPALDTDGFAAALDALGHARHVDVDVEGSPGGCPRDVLVVAFWVIDDLARTLPEEADGVRVAVTGDGGRLTLRVTALPPDAPLAAPHRDGTAWLDVAADRVAALRGDLSTNCTGAALTAGQSTPASGGPREGQWLEVSIPYA